MTIVEFWYRFIYEESFREDLKNGEETVRESAVQGFILNSQDLTPFTRNMNLRPLAILLNIKLNEILEIV